MKSLGEVPGSGTHLDHLAMPVAADGTGHRLRQNLGEGRRGREISPSSDGSNMLAVVAVLFIKEREVHEAIEAKLVLRCVEVRLEPGGQERGSGKR